MSLTSGKLSRVIPAHVCTVQFRWLKHDFMLMSENYRAIRGRMRDPLDTCRWCKHKFVNGEMMALAQPDKGANWVLCHSCADKAAIEASAEKAG